MQRGHHKRCRLFIIKLDSLSPEELFSEHASEESSFLQSLA